MPLLKKEWYTQLIVIDGHSSDGTVEYCREKGYPIYFQTGTGIVNAFDDAYRRVTSDIVVMATPDGNSLWELIPAMIAKIREGFDMVIASRYLGPAKSADDDCMTAIGNRFFTWAINLAFHARYTDTLVGMRAYRREAIDRMCLFEQHREFPIKEKFFQMASWDTGSSIRAAKLKLKVCEIPGDEPKRIGGQRKLPIVKNGCGALCHILHEYWIGKQFRRKAPAS